MPAAAGAADTAAAGGPAAAMRATLSQPRFVDEVSDWLAHRATTAEAQRFDRYMELIKQAAAAPLDAGSLSTSATLQSAASASKTQQRPVSTLGFTPAAAKKVQAAAGTAAAAAAGSNRPATASPSSPSWQYTSTTKATAAGKLVSGASSSGLFGQGLRPFTATAATSSSQAAAAAAAGPADKGSVPPAAASTSFPAASNGCSSSSSSAGGAPKCLNVTTAQAFHGLKELYPDLWAATTPICRPQPAPNKNFISEWGESLRQGAAEAWAPYLASTYQVANLQVAKPTDEFAVRADDALISWVAKQKLYFGDLLSPEAAAAVAALLEGRQPDPTAAAAADGAAAAGASQSGGVAAAAAAAAVGGGRSSAAVLPLADRKGLLEMLRQLSAVVLPDSTQPMSHTMHKTQYSVEQPATTALMKEQTRIKTMGFPRKAEVKGFAHTATKTASAAAAGAAGATAVSATASGGAAASAEGASAGSIPRAANQPGGKASKAVKASEMIDTLSSKVPLKWAAASVVTPASSYTTAFGAHPGRSPQMFKTMFKEVNVGYGHVDTHLHTPGSGAYPVEQLYLEPPVVPGQSQHEADQKTTQRMSYKPRDPESVARSVAAAREQIEASQAARNKSFIPLSKAGVQLGSSAQWCSAYGADFIPRKADLSANKAMASAVAGMFNGPTIAYGKIAGIRAADAAGIAKWKEQQAAAATAKAAADAELDRRAAAGTKGRA